ncbi:hypothetical protein [Alcaligenes faecalis]|uniref:Uncharacterized protein n=1 Tax=Alcaligenes faecalis TaxID=511 RepID=A0ABY7N7A3_ALCFA|nr:hypothetical protein [Alcaligenes faecalis]WBM40002.1 hypothetical protein M2J83_09385 [Alcaligenes faecalis]
MRVRLRLAAAWFFAALSGGAIGGFGGQVLVSWLNNEPKLWGAEWWDAMTAFGTIGATIAAVIIAGRSEIRAERERVRRGLSLKWFVAMKLGDIKAGAALAQEEMQKIVKLPKGTVIEGPVTFMLQKSLPMLDLSGIAGHLGAIHALGEDSHRYSEVFAYAEARYKELSVILEGRFCILEGNDYLEGVVERFKYLSDLTEKTIEMLNRPI